jgi:hypothetical protein
MSEDGMLMIVRSPRAFGWGTSYELQLFRDGHWVISAVFDDRREALEEAHRLDRSGKLVRLRADEIDDSGKSRGTRTVFLSSTIKKTWKAERERIAQRERRHPMARMDDDDGERGHPINPYVLLAIFAAIAFSGLAAIFALRSLYDAV